jgi:hypothetical protein
MVMPDILFMYSYQIICYWLILNVFSLKKLTAMHEIENPSTYALRDELKFPKVSLVSYVAWKSITSVFMSLHIFKQPFS